MGNMSWVEPIYTQKSAWFGPSGVLDHHRARAATIKRLCGPAPKRVLELGAGAGGSAVATALLGYSVVAIELSPLRARFARELAINEASGCLSVIEADFFTANFDGRFDVVTYWNGFGIGTDRDQQRLLCRIADEWLTPDGCALIDIFSPCPRSRAAGQTQRDEESGLWQRYDFDPVGCRFLDQWWPDDRKDEMITQAIRCYTPADFQTLLDPVSLTVDRIEVGGTAIEPSSAASTTQHSLWEAWDYLVKLVRKGAT